jgi:phosphatidate cytidylyltransferase
MNSYIWPYLLITFHFISGAIWILLINRKLDQTSVKQQWTKYFTYVALFNLIWNSIIWYHEIFIVLGYLLIILCSWEWWNVIKKTEGRKWFFAGFLVVMVGFWSFLYRMESDILFAFFVVVLFDGSSQIAGQLVGRNPLLPKISPGKTIEGLVGGTLITLGSVLLVRNSFLMEWSEIIFKCLLIMASAFLGDLAASYAKRKASLDTFGKLLPGHGGFLDRFDSLILVGFVISLLSLLNVLW